MVDLYKEIDFSQEIRNIPKLEKFLKQAAQEVQSSLPNDRIPPKPYLKTNFDKYIFLTGIPVMDVNKLKIFNEKLLLGQILVKLGIKDFFKKADYGFQENKQFTNGSALIKFNTVENAKLAAEKLNGLKIDLKHVFHTFTYEEFDRIMESNDEYKEPKCLTDADLQQWAATDNYREQFSYTNNNRIYINWFDHLEENVINAIQGGEYVQLAEQSQASHFQWSKNGGYLVAFLKTGFQLYGGLDMKPLNFFQHLDVQAVEFSQNEKYIVSFNNTVLYAPNSENYILWNTLSGEALRVFRAEARDQWGSFKFSSCSNFIARCGENTLSVYELPSVKLIMGQDQKRAAIKVSNIEKFEWIPGQKVICCVSYVQEKDKDQQANKGSQSNTKVTLIDIETRQEYRKWKSITFDLNDCQIYSTLQGDCLVLAMTKRLGKKKTSTLVHIGSLSKNKLDIHDFEITDKVVSFDFEKHSRRMVYSYDDTEKGQTILKYSFVLYNVDKENNNQVKEIGRIEKKILKECLISSQGQFFALVNKDSSHAFQGSLEFYNIKLKDQKSNTYEFELLKDGKMNYMTHASWDPSGKFLITGSITTNTVMIWSSYGKQLYKDTFNKMNQLLWRNRPQVVIPAQKEKEILDNYKTISNQYAQFDDSIINRAKREQEAKQKEQKDQFIRFMAQKRKEWEALRDQRKQLLGFDEENRTDLVLDEIIEKEIVIEKEEVE